MASSPQHEPTMEEILASIRKIISEDSSETPAPEAEAVAPPVTSSTAAVATVAPVAEPVEDDVLDLTDEVQEPAAAAIQEEPAHVPEVPVAVETAPAVEVLPDSEIFTEKTRRAMGDTFAKIDAPVEMPRHASSVADAIGKTIDGNSVEAVFERAVRDAVGPHIDQWMVAQKDDLLIAMRPLIREWMDENFPTLLENAVRDEMARALKARTR